MKKEAEFLIKNIKDPMTISILNNARYTKGAIKETFRLNPLSFGIDKVLKHDTILNGYIVPAGVIFFLSTKYFKLNL